MEIFCFAMGILYAYTYNMYLPLALAVLFFITPKYSMVFLFLLGMGVAWIHLCLISTKGMPDLPLIPQALLEGTLASIPIREGHKTQFSFALEKLNHKPARGLLQLSWYNKAPLLQVGQRWLLKAKIKKPRNFRNPGSADYLRMLHTRHITWVGYVLEKKNLLIKESPLSWSWLRLRESLARALRRLAPDKQTAGIVESLTLNLTTHISQENWSLFRRTGTTHLFGISGEHIALISGLFTLIIQWVWSRSVLCCLWIPAIAVASAGGFFMALLYAFLAGFAPPVQRALLGCFFYTLYYLGKGRFTAWQVWRYALFGVLCLEPHAVFMQGFYFSFLAVVCLLLVQQRWQLKRYKKSLVLQFSCLIGLMPLTLYWFSYGSINGYIANLFAIPLVGSIIVPLALLTMLFSSFSWSWLLMKPLSWSIALLFKGLIWTEQLAFINITCSLRFTVLLLALMGALLMWVVLPVKPFKYLSLLWLLIPFFPPKNAIYPGEAVVQILDVGQGLAVSIQTQHHTLLYDTGDQFFRGSNLGTMVILPYYRWLGIKKIDKIVISHPDKDHRGGLASIEAGLEVKELLVNDRHYYDHGFSCHDYPTWQWDGVTFRFFPINEVFHEKNNNSCILQVSSASASVLFTGDIEKTAEDYLVRRYGARLASEVLIVPHHGSKTSSSYRFLMEVAPLYAIASLGFANRFHFPHEQTLANMQSLGIAFFRTDECGMVSLRLPKQGAIQRPVCYTG